MYIYTGFPKLSLHKKKCGKPVSHIILFSFITRTAKCTAKNPEAWVAKTCTFQYLECTLTHLWLHTKHHPESHF